MDNETNLEGGEMVLLLLTSFDLYEKKWKCFGKSCLLFKHWTHICTKNHDQLLNECHHKEEQINNKIKKMKGEH
jgi:hypothetical protein